MLAQRISFARKALQVTTTRMSSIYDFSVETMAGEPKPMSDYEGKVILIENTASL